MHRKVRPAQHTVAILVAALAAVLTLGCGVAVKQRSLVHFRRSGGFAGFDDHLIVEPDGRARLTVGTSSPSARTYRGSVTAAIQGKLEKALRHAQLPKLDRRYGADSAVRDAITYQVTYRRRTVEAQDTAVPGQLSPAVGILENIVIKLRPRPVGGSSPPSAGSKEPRSPRGGSPGLRARRTTSPTRRRPVVPAWRRRE